MPPTISARSCWKSQGACLAGGFPARHDGNKSFVSLRDRIEAAGGKLRLASTPTGEFSLVAELNFSEIEQADG